MVPMNTPITVDGVVSNKSDSSSLAGIQVELHSILITGCMPSTVHDTLLLKGNTGSDGRFSLELEEAYTKNHYVRVVDTDGAANGGVFQADSSESFNAYYDPDPHNFYLEIDPASDVTGQRAKVHQPKVLPVVTPASVSLHLRTSWNSRETAESFYSATTMR